MLRITVHDEAGEVVIKAEGVLASLWVDELSRCAHAVLSAMHHASAALDLTDVTFVDQRGRRLLAELAHQGVRLISGDPVMDAVVENIRLKQTQSRVGKAH